MASELLQGLRLLLVSKRLSIQIIKNHCVVTYNVVSYSAKLIKRLKLSTTTRQSFAFYQKTINDWTDFNKSFNKLSYANCKRVVLYCIIENGYITRRLYRYISATLCDRMWLLSKGRKDGRGSYFIGRLAVCGVTWAYILTGGRSAGAGRGRGSDLSILLRSRMLAAWRCTRYGLP